MGVVAINTTVLIIADLIQKSQRYDTNRLCTDLGFQLKLEDEHRYWECIVEDVWETHPSPKGHQGNQMSTNLIKLMSRLMIKGKKMGQHLQYIGRSIPWRMIDHMSESIRIVRNLVSSPSINNRTIQSNQKINKKKILTGDALNLPMRKK